MTLREIATLNYLFGCHVATTERVGRQLLRHFRARGNSSATCTGAVVLGKLKKSGHVFSMDTPPVWRLTARGKNSIMNLTWS